VDRLYGGDGDDQLYVWEDGAEDHLYCGEGHDTYYLWDVDSSHHVSTSCEEEQLMFTPPANPGDPAGGMLPPPEFYYD
jgi:hypothetical protein